MENSTILEQRVQQLENSLYQAKKILSFEEACAFLNFSKSYLYKLTSACAIPHYDATLAEYIQALQARRRAAKNRVRISRIR
jgi:hypothetical protein